MTTYLFLDTNIYLHYCMFDEIDWPALVGTDSVVIVIPPVTARELNKHKDGHSVPRIKKRAGAVLRKLFELLREKDRVVVKKGIELWLEDREPRIDFPSHQLDRTVADDHLLASILSLRTEASGSEMILVTADRGIHLMGKARRQNIRPMFVPDEYKLNEEPDPAQKELLDLRRQLAEERTRRPKLALVFDNGEPHAQFRIYPPISRSPEEILKQIETVKQKHPKRKLPQNTEGKTMRELRQEAKTLGSAFNLSLFAVTPVAIQDYNDKLDKFYLQYEQYLERLHRHEDRMRRTITLNIQVKNTGTTPAEDLDVFLHFPDGSYVFEARRLPKPPEPPQPPATPESHLSSMFKPTVVPYLSPPRHNLPDFGPEPNVSSPSIRRTNSYDVEVRVGRVKHGIPESLDALCVMFESYETASSFKIAYRIHSANVPEPDEDMLHVIIDKISSDA